MSRNNIKLIKENVSLTDVLNLYGIKVNVKNMCLCPIHQDSNPSFKVNSNGDFKCFGCGKYGDVIDLIKYIENISQADTINFLIERFNLDKNYAENKNYKPKIIYKKESNKLPHFKNPKVIEYVKNCIKDVELTNYFKNRGLLPNIINRFKLGYDKNEKAVVIPYNTNLTYYQRRYVNYHRFYKVPQKIAGCEPIFNVGAFKTSNVIFIVESPICAISIAQCGGVSIPLCGVANIKNLLKYLDKNVYKGTLILCLDNDVIGVKATNELIYGISKEKIKGLKALNIKYLKENIADIYKDPNELLIKDFNKLKLNIENVLSKINEKGNVNYEN